MSGAEVVRRKAVTLFIGAVILFFALLIAPASETRKNATQMDVIFIAAFILAVQAFAAIRDKP